jgi:hypothetical protein
MKLTKTLLVPLAAWLEANDNIVPPPSFNVKVELADKYTATGTVVEIKPITMQGLTDDDFEADAVVIKDFAGNIHTAFLFDAKIFVPYEVLRIK